MCGIAGIINLPLGYDISANSKKILDLLDHRGPDQRGYLHLNNNLLCHNRLSVIDLSSNADQPYSIEHLHLIYNGECYNYKELRVELELLGHLFQSNSDTEVVLRLFMEFGVDFVSKIIGMFALAIYNDKSGETFLARDHTGIKPLYWSTFQNSFIYSSEIKPILIHKSRFKINENSIGLYLKYRYVPGDETLFDEIMSIPSGSLWIIDETGHVISKKNYWSPEKILIDTQKSKADFNEKFTEIFEESCLLQTRSDVPVGLLLSGGIDSSAIAATISKLEMSVNSFTMKMNENVGETELASSISDNLNIKNSTVNFDESIIDNYRKAIYYLEDPIGDSIIAPTLVLLSAVSKNNKVVYSGEGADEILNGYVHHFALYYQHLFARFFPNRLIRFLGKLLKLLPQSIFELAFLYPSKLGKNGTDKILRQISKYDNGYNAYSNLIEMFSDEELSESGTEIKNNPIRNYFESSNLSFMDTVTRVDLIFWNTNYTLHRLDRLSMANSVEARVPFLDHRLASLCLSAPKTLLFKNLKQKVVLRDFLKKQKILSAQEYQRKKFPFFLPVNQSSSRILKDWLYAALDDPFIAKYLSEKVLNEIRNDGEKDLLTSKKLMAIAILSNWQKIFIEFYETNRIKGL